MRSQKLFSEKLKDFRDRLTKLVTIIRGTIIVTSILIVTSKQVIATPIISDVSPDSGLEGTSISITGTGFTNTSQVLFHSFPSGREDYGSFDIVNDGVVNAVVPIDYPFNVWADWLVSIFDSEGASIAFQDTVTEITGSSSGGGSSSYIVRDGGVLTGGFGSSVVFVESGGLYRNLGGGSNLIFIEDNATFISDYGIGGELYYESFASINIGSGSNTGTELSDVNFTILGQVAPVPEPATMILFASGLLGLVVFKKKTMQIHG